MQSGWDECLGTHTVEEVLTNVAGCDRDRVNVWMRWEGRSMWTWRRWEPGGMVSVDVEEAGGGPVICSR